MILYPNKRNHKLTQHIDYLEFVDIKIKEVWSRLIRVKSETINQWIEDEKLGIPLYFVFIPEKDKLIVYPKPDIEYECRVVGSVIIEQ